MFRLECMIYNLKCGYDTYVTYVFSITGKVFILNVLSAAIKLIMCVTYTGI